MFWFKDIEIQCTLLYYTLLDYFLQFPFNILMVVILITNHYEKATDVTRDVGGNYSLFCDTDENVDYNSKPQSSHYLWYDLD